MAAPDDDWVADFLLSDLKRQCHIPGLSLPDSPKRPRRDRGDDGTLARLRKELGTVRPYPAQT